MKLPAASLYAGVFFALMICACNLSEHPADTLLNVKLDDSLSSYDSIQLDILYPDGKVFKDAIFIGKYTPGPDHELKNLNLGENPPTEFRIRITGIRKGKRALEIVVPVTSAGPQASEVVYRELPIDTVRPPITTEPNNVEITTPSPLVLFTGTADFSVSARVKPMEAPQGLLWMTSNNGVARVDSTGKIIPVTVGEADITARSRRDTTLFATLHLVVKDSVLIKGIKVSAESLLLYTGGASIKLIGQIDPADVNLSVVYSSRNDSVAKAGADGTISPVKSGKTEVLVFPAGMPALAVAVVVTVKTDMPVLEAGSDRFVNALDTLNFPLKVTQEYGSVAALKWDLDGNGIWDDSTTLAEANPRRMYDGKDSLIAIHFYVRDGEGNVSVADKKVHVNPRPILAAPTFTSATTTSPTRSPRPTWAWTGAKGGSGTFRYSLDNKPEVETRALSYTADSLADGEHILVLRELDSLGVASLSSSKTLKIITKAQSVTITSPT
ncbi:MAG: hypothetical protein ABIW76_07690, partial [Fibrobacteria bacterium]